MDKYEKHDSVVIVKSSTRSSTRMRQLQICFHSKPKSRECNSAIIAVQCMSSMIADSKHPALSCSVLIAIVVAIRHPSTSPLSLPHPPSPISIHAQHPLNPHFPISPVLTPSTVPTTSISLSGVLALTGVPTPFGVSNPGNFNASPSTALS